MTIRDLFFYLIGLDSVLCVLYAFILVYWSRQWREKMNGKDRVLRMGESSVD